MFATSPGASPAPPRTPGGPLGCALRAGFPYVAMLANDLRGHALAQGGDSALGGAVLLLARDQARRLGYVANAHAIELAITLYRARDATPREAASLLTDAVAREVTQDSYSRRTLRLELATLLAWMGRAAAARSLVEEAAPQCAGSLASARSSPLRGPTWRGCQRPGRRPRAPSTRPNAGSTTRGTPPCASRSPPSDSPSPASLARPSSRTPRGSARSPS